ncbi:carbamoyltransferase HypF [Actinoplanes sp. KI2]|uniref:carbamoyltransferase HypF n=1 Tax=Actinoplanes sp. KI2 TaxID=2983315 RepID=UPI0021D5DFB8|nr:carbamoyltransferase HypF [Actinoplanes sp. KI2]MCU7729487.1 carbamoyltransferase HypF [Actinoplanes sp. KI2]
MTVTPAPAREAWSIRVEGTVQGVGFRPFVHRLATGLRLDGVVRNVDGDVLIEVAGPAAALAALARALREQPPPNAVVTRVSVTPGGGESAAIGVGTGFTVAVSGWVPGVRAGFAGLPVDLATCDDCLRELFDPADRRYRYPFVNCTACGPRATIVDGLPYDRVRTAMAGFPLCADCAAEYQDPGDRRFHAEPVACPACGPSLSWQPAGATGEGALSAAVAAIAAGQIVAVKGLGGYQLVCDATDAAAVDRLRARKRRPRKPFAVMVADVAAARALSRLTPAELRLLTEPARPIVLLTARPGMPLAPGVHPGTDQVGLFLPYTPLHHLLLRALARPLVVTSGNLSDEPIAIDDGDALIRLAPVADGFLLHDRPIRARYDDSVARVIGERRVTVRRARGYAPGPLPLPVPAARPVLAVGAQLKHTFTLARGDRALVGPHGGSLDDADALAAFHGTLGQLSRLHRFTPEVLAHDLHPGYLSTRYAAEQPAGLRRVPVQHHHAHVVSCAAENGIRGPFLGVAYDGLGLGADGTLWGGELLLASYTGFRRLGRFGTAPLPGGEAAVRHPARMALGYLLGGEFPVPAGSFDRLAAAERDIIARMIARGVNSPRASSAGRLFDAVSSLLGLCDEASYEGEAAVLLEAVAAAVPRAEALPWRLTEVEGLWVYDWSGTLTAVLDRTRAGVPAGELAAAFHTTIVEVTVALCARAAERTGVTVVCLSGGCLQNRILASRLRTELDAAGLTGHLNRDVPANDGGISYGQAVVAAAICDEGG